MPSSWGRRHGMPGFDKFRSGLDYDTVKAMLWSPDEDRATWKYRRRGTVLGFWHQLKLQLWHQMQDELRPRPRSGEARPEG